MLVLATMGDIAVALKPPWAVFTKVHKKTAKRRKEDFLSREGNSRKTEMPASCSPNTEGYTVRLQIRQCRDNVWGRAGKR